jgi:hypothetical protein
MDVSTDHKPGDPPERLRIEAAGGCGPALRGGSLVPRAMRAACDARAARGGRWVGLVDASHQRMILLDESADDGYTPGNHQAVARPSPGCCRGRFRAAAAAAASEPRQPPAARRPARAFGLRLGRRRRQATPPSPGGLETAASEEPLGPIHPALNAPCSHLRKAARVYVPQTVVPVCPLTPY